MTTTLDTRPVHCEPVTTSDLPGIAALHARAFGPGRFARSAYRVREGSPPFSPCCRLIREDGRIKGAVRFTAVTIGGRSGAYLLGPIAVEPGEERRGLGRDLIASGLDAVSKTPAELVVLVGDLAYYERHGFARVPPGAMAFPGPVDPARILAREFRPGAIGRFTGLLAAGPLL